MSNRGISDKSVCLHFFEEFSGIAWNITYSFRLMSFYFFKVFSIKKNFFCEYLTRNFCFIVLPVDFNIFWNFSTFKFPIAGGLFSGRKENHINRHLEKNRKLLQLYCWFCVLEILFAYFWNSVFFCYVKIFVFLVYERVINKYY